jgi:hypothetical protein
VKNDIGILMGIDFGNVDIFTVLIRLLVFFSTCSLLVYRETSNFCMLILYPAALPKVIITSKSFGVFGFLFICFSEFVRVF